MYRLLTYRGMWTITLVLLVAVLAGCTALPELPTPATGATPAGPGTVTMYVGPELADCVGVAPQKCMQTKARPEDPYTLFYSQINGFTFEPGYEYQLSVKVEPAANPPADAPAFTYTLVDVVSKTPVTARAESGTPSAGAAPAGGNSLATPEVQPGVAPSPVEGSLWKAIAYADAKGNLVNVLPQSEVTAQFQGGKLTGKACNVYNGIYKVDGNKLTVKLAATTMMACPNDIMQQEKTYLAALAKSATYQIEQGQLQIAGANGKPLVVYNAVVPQSLVMTDWSITAYNNGKQAIVSVLADAPIDLVFGNDGQVHGNAGCNDYNAPFKLDGNKLTIGAIATTRKMCPEPVMGQETAYLAALGKVASYQIEGNRLVLFNSEGLRYVEGESAAIPTQPAPGPTPAPTAAAQAAPAAPAAAARAAAVPAQVMDALKNLEYKSAYTASGTAPLKDGKYEEPAAPGSAAKTTVLLTNNVAIGDLNGDAVADAAAVLATNTGGTGVFMDLAAVVQQNGQLKNVATAPLGDRVKINSLTIQGGQIVIDMLAQGPNDPMASPTQEVLKTYKLQGNQLVQTSSKLVNGAAGGGQPASGEQGGTAAQPKLVGPAWQWIETQYSNDTKQTVPNPSKYTVQFKPDGTLALQVDCNRGGGTYTTKDSSLSIQGFIMGRMGCGPESLSAKFIDELNNAASYVMQDGKLIINGKMDTGNTVFAPSVPVTVQ